MVLIIPLSVDVAWTDGSWTAIFLQIPLPVFPQNETQNSQNEIQNLQNCLKMVKNVEIIGRDVREHLGKLVT